MEAVAESLIGKQGVIEQLDCVPVGRSVSFTSKPSAVFDRPKVPYGSIERDVRGVLPRYLSFLLSRDRSTTPPSILRRRPTSNLDSFHRPWAMPAAPERRKFRDSYQHRHARAIGPIGCLSRGVSLELEKPPAGITHVLRPVPLVDLIIIGTGVARNRTFCVSSSRPIFFRGKCTSYDAGRMDTSVTEVTRPFADHSDAPLEAFRWDLQVARPHVDERQLVRRTHYDFFDGEWHSTSIPDRVPCARLCLRLPSRALTRLECASVVLVDLARSWLGLGCTSPPPGGTATFPSLPCSRSPARRPPLFPAHIRRRARTTCFHERVKGPSVRPCSLSVRSNHRVPSLSIQTASIRTLSCVDASFRTYIARCKDSLAPVSPRRDTAPRLMCSHRSLDVLLGSIISSLASSQTSSLDNLASPRLAPLGSLGTHLTLGTLIAPDIKMHLLHRLLHHAHAIRPLRSRIDDLVRDQARHLLPQIAQRVVPLLFTDLEFALEQDGGDDLGDGRGPKGGLEVGCFRDLAFGYVGEYVGDLEDFVDVFFTAGRRVSASPGVNTKGRGTDSHARSVLAHLVLVTRNLESLAALFDTDDADVCQPGRLRLGVSACGRGREGRVRTLLMPRAG